MEYRIHEKNEIKLSLIGVNFSTNSNGEGRNSYKDFKNQLNNLSSLNINHVCVSAESKSLIKILTEWERENGIHLIKSIIFGDLFCNIAKNNGMNFHELVIQNRFLDIKKDINQLIKECNLKKINFLTLFYPKSQHFIENDFNTLSSELKKEGLINSFGIKCQYLSDAIAISNKYNIDHIVVDLDINSSSELINTLFKTTTNKSVAVFCTLKVENSYLEDKNLIVDELKELLDQGYNQFKTNLDSILGEKDNNILILSLKKFFMYDIQTIIVSNTDIAKINNFYSNSSINIITNSESLAVQQAFEPPKYESPKKKIK